jgi:outer membrane protein assembly factor BamA
MTLPHKFAALLLACLLLQTAGTATQAPHKAPAKETADAPKKLVAINVSGSSHFTRDDVTAASGVQIGDAADDADFKRAAQLLVESGAFSDVAYQYSPARQGVTLEWQLKDAPKFVPAEFDNFVWLPQSQLSDELHKLVPLFHGELPVGGTLLDQISDALQLLLNQRKVSARVDYLRVTPLGSEELSSVRYTVTEIPIHIAQVSFPGAAPEDAAVLVKVASRLIGDDYSAAKLVTNAEKSFLPILRQRGYLKASFGKPEPKLAEREGKETGLLVDVVLPVSPGFRYLVQRIAWSGSTVFPAEKLAPMVHLVPGKPADATQLENDLRGIAQRYGTRGYMKAQVEASPSFDDSRQTVSYDLRVHEGDQYHMGDLDLQGPDQKTTDQLIAAWSLREGEVYDSSYPRQFLDDNMKLLPTNFRWSATVHDSINDKDHTVDVTIRYTARAN